MKLLEFFKIVKVFNLERKKEWLDFNFPRNFNFIEYFLSSPKFIQTSSMKTVLSTSYLEEAFDEIPAGVALRVQRENGKNQASGPGKQAGINGSTIENLFIDMNRSIKRLRESQEVNQDRAKVISLKK